MAFADFDWATDTNYPAGSATWSATPTKVAPSAGVQADGFAPEDQPPAQWINWLFNGIITAGQALETSLGDGTIQWAFDNSVAEADLTIPTVQSALVAAPTTGAVSLLALSGGLWTPVVSAVSGSDIVTGDITNTSGYSARIGNLALFAFRFTLNTTGFDTSPRDITFTPPFGTPNAPSAGVARAENLTANRFVNILLLGSVNGICIRVSPGSDVGTGRVISVCGMYGCS